MSQQDIYNILKQHEGKWLSAREISNKLNTPLGSVTNSLKRLRKGGSVRFKQIHKIVKPAGERAIFVYRYKN